MISRLVFFGAIVLFPSCDTIPTAVSHNELLEYVNNLENGLIKKVSKNGVEFELVYKPKDFMIAQEVRGTNSAIAAKDSLRDYYREYEYFVLKISKDGKEIESSLDILNVDNKYLVIANFFERLANNISISSSEKSFSPIQVMYVPTFGATSSSNALVVFNSEILSQESQFKMIINAADIGCGKIEFTLNVEDIKNIPALIF